MQLYRPIWRPIRRPIRHSVLTLLLAAFLGSTGATVCWAADAGTVVRLRGEATAAGTALNTGDPVAIGARLRTGKGARLQVRLLDGTDLTLGESADFIIDELVLTPTSGNAVFHRLAGAFQMVAGAIAERQNHDMRVEGIVGTIGIRGTAFWAGQVRDLLDVYLIEGDIRVRSPGGAVELTRPGSGTHIGALGATPDEPIQWPAALRELALATTSFDTP